VSSIDSSKGIIDELLSVESPTEDDDDENDDEDDEDGLPGLPSCF
jgi:hypothetical protein